MQNDTSVIRLKKQILDEAGKPAETVRPGDLLTVSISSENAIGIDSFVLLDLLPGGCAIENGSLATRQASTGDAEEKNDGILVRHKERHDDRFIIMGALDGGKPFAITYKMRTITPGSFAIPPVHLEDMYNPDIQATFAPDATLEVKAE